MQKNNVVTRGRTDKNGELINMSKLYLRKYEAVKPAAPAGYLMNTIALPFEFTYEGQDVELVSQSLEPKIDFQQLKVIVHKNEEQIQGWKENTPVIKEVKANEKVFAVFTN